MCIRDSNKTWLYLWWISWHTDTLSLDKKLRVHDPFRPWPSVSMNQTVYSLLSSPPNAVFLTWCLYSMLCPWHDVSMACCIHDQKCPLPNVSMIWCVYDLMSPHICCLTNVACLHVCIALDVCEWGADLACTQKVSGANLTYSKRTQGRSSVGTILVCYMGLHEQRCLLKLN